MNYKYLRLILSPFKSILFKLPFRSFMPFRELYNLCQLVRNPSLRRFIAGFSSDNGRNTLFGSPTLGQLDAAIRYSMNDEYYKAIATWCHMSNSKIVIDVGANIGYFSLFLARDWPELLIYSLEPSKKNLTYLLANTLMEPNLTVCSFGLSSKNESRKLFMPATAAGRPGEKKYNTGLMTMVGIESDEYERVHAITFNDFTTSYGIPLEEIGYLKIDVEGLEYDVLKSILPLASSLNNCCIEVELNNESLRRDGHSVSDILLLAKQYGYCVFAISANQTVNKTDAQPVVSDVLLVSSAAKHQILQIFSQFVTREPLVK